MAGNGMGGSVATILPDDPYLVNNNEVTGSCIVSEVLVGPENYTKWKRSMEIAISGKSKLGFVRGDYPRPADPVLLLKWQRCNDIVMSWLICSVSKGIVGTILHAKDAASAWKTLHEHLGGSNETRLFGLEREIANFVQGDLTVASYYQKLVDLWEELDAMEVMPNCTHGDDCVCHNYIVAKLRKRKVIQFLMGLNDSFLPLRTHILATSPLPNLNVIYAMAVQDEIQKNMSKLPYVEASAMYAQSQEEFNTVQNKTGQQGRSSVNSNAGNKIKRNLFCSYCQKQGHVRETCYKLNGYPPGHRFYKGNDKTTQYNRGGNNNNQKFSANNIVAENTSPSQVSEGSGSVPQLTGDQIQQLLALLHQSNNNNDKQIGVAGPSVQDGFRDW